MQNIKLNPCAKSTINVLLLWLYEHFLWCGSVTNKLTLRICCENTKSSLHCQISKCIDRDFLLQCRKDFLSFMHVFSFVSYAWQKSAEPATMQAFIKK